MTKNPNVCCQIYPHKLRLIQFIILFAFSIISTSYGQVVFLDQDFKESHIDSAARYWRIPHKNKSVNSSDAWASMKKMELSTFSAKNLGSIFTRGLYNYWIQIIYANKSDREINIFTDLSYNILSVDKLENAQPKPVLFIDQYTNTDPNGILKIRERQGFTATIHPESIDTFLLQVYSPSVSSSFHIRSRETNKMTEEYLQRSPWITFFNGLFLGFLILCFTGSIYYYYRTRLDYVLWYALYLLLFLLYFWREFEFLNKYFDFTHNWITWHMAKFPIGALLFLCYLSYIHQLLESNQRNKWIAIFLRLTLIAIPICIVMDILFQLYYPFGSYIMMYSFGIIVGVLQVLIVVPLYRQYGEDKAIKAIIIGSVFLFIGWLSILFFPLNIHRGVLRFCSLVELLCFVIAIAERGMQIYLAHQTTVLKQTIALREERIRISSELHDEIGATLSGISMYSYMTKNQLLQDQFVTAQQSLKIIKSSAQEMYEKLNDVVWSVQNDNDNIYELLEGLYKNSQQIAAAQNIQLKYDLSADLVSYKFPLAMCRNLYLFCKEAATNAIKYSQGSLITIKVSKIIHQLIIEIEDDGIGFEMELVDLGNGIENMKRRANDMDGTFSLKSKPGNGTKIFLELSI